MRRCFLGLVATFVAISTAAAAETALREDFAAPFTLKPNGDVVIGGLTYLRDNNPNGTIEPIDGGVRLSVGRGGPEAKPLNAEGDLYERAEIRESRSRYLPPGTEAWYRFSLRVPPDFPRSAGRFVVAQLKTPYRGYDEASPAVAIRLESRQLFATVEHLFDARSETAAPAADGGCPAGSALASRHDDADIPQIRVLLAADAAGLPPRRVPQYAVCAKGITVERHGSLPSDAGGWIDLMLHIRPGPSGRIALYVEGKLVATAVGDFGDADPKGRQYFKFGPYRDKVEGVAALDFARFRRGSTREAVED